MATTKPYDKFGIVYDHIGHDRFSTKMAEYTLQLLEQHKFLPTDGLDLCCGSGSAIEYFCDQGIAMSGLDRSGAMLASARKKLKGHGVKLYRQALPKFDIRVGRNSQRRRFDLITCFFDSLNYLQTERELMTAFRAVHRHLRPGGWFVFDMNTPYMLNNIADEGGGPTSTVSDDVACVFRDKPGARPDVVDFLLTVFVRKGRHWQRYDETHRERAYATSKLRRWLREVGFQVKGCYRCFKFTPPEKTTRRVCITARKPVKK